MTLTHHRNDFFEKSAPYYDIILDLLTFGQYAEFQKRTIKLLAPEKRERILDLCSGTGRVASLMAQAVGDGGEIVGMDIAKSMLGVARKRYGKLKNVIFLQQDVTQPWRYQNYFDGIFTSFAIHELPELKRQEVFERSHFALKTKGRMVIADFNPQVSGKSKTISVIFFKFFERENLNFFSIDQNEMLKKAGFKRIKTFPVLGGILQTSIAFKV